MKSIVFIVFLAFLSNAEAQNILNNSSFEDYIKLTQSIIYPSKWAAPNMLSSVDYYSDSAVLAPEFISIQTPSINILNSSFGSHRPYHGDSYIGIALFSWRGAMEHFCGELVHPMKKDSLYTISFAMKYPSDITWLYSNKFEILFTHEKLKYPINDYNLLFANNEQSHKASLVFNIDSVNKSREWVRCTANYKAKGDEQYITLGLFGQQDKKLSKIIGRFNKKTLDYPNQVKFVETYETGLIKANPHSKRYRRDYQALNIAYYLLDDFSISPANNNAVEFTY